jgi:N-acetylglucosaminyldiphosphoundecaprenol N-acetyl-beta-D-mannosaminyltransferase
MEALSTKSLTIFGIPFCADRKDAILNQICTLARENQASSVIFANAHVVVEAHHRPCLKSAINSASLVVPDGVPITWVLKGKGQKHADRYSGPDVMEDVLEKKPETSHFFLGSTPETLERIRRRFQGTAVGFYSPPFTENGFSPEEKAKQLALIEEARPDFIWVGLGAPKQEYYVTEMASKASRGVWLAVGAAFDFYAGPKPRAPKILQKVGLEWAFRLATEPRRLGRRYLMSNPVFIKLALRELVGGSNNGKSML